LYSDSRKPRFYFSRLKEKYSGWVLQLLDDNLEDGMFVDGHSQLVLGLGKVVEVVEQMMPNLAYYLQGGML